MDQITVEFDRASVHAGDDVDHHRDSWPMPATATLGDVVQAVLDRRVLASIAGDVSWTLCLGRGPRGRDLAVIDVPHRQQPAWRVLGDPAVTIGALATEAVLPVFVS